MGISRKYRSKNIFQQLIIEKYKLERIIEITEEVITSIPLDKGTNSNQHQCIKNSEQRSTIPICCPTIEASQNNLPSNWPANGAIDKIPTLKLI